MNTISALPVGVSRFTTRRFAIHGLAMRLLSTLVILFASLDTEGQTLRPSLAAPLGMGGGYTAAGLTGDYYATAVLPADGTTPAFTRRDVRLDFGTSYTLRPGGCTTPGYAEVGPQNWSARWKGQIVARFSENYTYNVYANDTVVVKIRPAGSGGYTTLVNQPAYTGNWITSAGYAMTAGEKYDFVVEFTQTSVDWGLVVKWSSPSTPEEVIEPMSVNGTNISDYFGHLFADGFKYIQGNSSNHHWFHPTTVYGDGNFDVNQAGNTPLSGGELDSDYWPTTDAYMQYPGAGSYTTGGNYTLTFKGKADVRVKYFWFGAPYGTFRVNGTDYAILPAGVGYDALTNTTTATLIRPPNDNGNANTLAICFTNTQRTAGSALQSGITDVHLYRATTFQGSTPCPIGSVVYPPIKNVLENYTLLRFFSGAFSDTRYWSERVRPTMPMLNRANSIYNDEYFIMLANEIGRDLLLSVPARVDTDTNGNLTDEYYVRLARLVQYGSDGNEPYTSTQVNPVYPPLNPNLRFHIEYSNEVWNFGFAQYSYAYNDSAAAVANNTAAGQILNFDGLASAGHATRWQAIKTVQISDAFRSVCGDAAMGRRIRVFFFDQYAGYGNSLLDFMNIYYNNGDGQAHVANPHPPSHYIWGGGGAIYYGTTNPLGSSFPDFDDPDEPVLANFSGESPVLAAGQVSTLPSGAGWTFQAGSAGDAGVYRNTARQPAITGQTLGSQTQLTGNYGFRFQVGANPIYVYNVGRWVSSFSPNGNNKTIYLFRESDGVTLANTGLNLANAAAGGYLYMPVQKPGWTMQSQTPVRLEANTVYGLVCTETASGEVFYGGNTGVTAASGITILNSISADSSSGWVATTLTNGSYAAGPVNFQFTTTPMSGLEFPQDAPDGSQALFIRGNGSISQSVNFTRAGVYSLGYYAAGKTNLYTDNDSALVNSIELFVDGVKITPKGGINVDWNPNTNPWSPGGFERRFYNFNIWWGSATFEIGGTSPLGLGTHTITIQGVGQADDYLYLDRLLLTNDDQLFGGLTASHFPAMGSAYGQDATANYRNTLKAECNFAAAWGLHPTAYEGGWSVGGDFDQKPLHLYCKYNSPYTLTADARSINLYTELGGSLFCYYYTQWLTHDTDTAENSSLVQAVIQRNDLLPVEAGNGYSIPGILLGSQHTLRSAYNGNWTDAAGAIKEPGGWISWNILAPISYGQYRLTANTVGSGATVAILLNGTETLATGPSGTPLSATVGLVKGLHTVRVRNLSGAADFTVSNLTVDMLGGPGQAAILTAGLDGAGNAVVTWSPVTGAAGYVVRYGEYTLTYSNTVTTGAVTSLTIPGLDVAKAYYLAVAAFDAGGVYGLSSSEVRIAARTDNPEVSIDFEDQPLVEGSNYLVEPFVIGGYSFTSFGNGAGAALHMRYYSPPGTKAIASRYWSTSLRLQRDDGQPFDLHSLDIAGSGGQSTMSVLIRAYDPNGSSFDTIVNIPNTENIRTHLVPDWRRIFRLEFTWYELPNGGGGTRAGHIDNLVFNYTPPTLAIATTTLPDGNVNYPYTQTLASTGGYPPLTWSLDSGSLPDGLTLSSSGVISGTPTTADASTFTVRIDDANYPITASDTQALTLTILKAKPNAPSSLQATALSGTQSALSWVDNSNDEILFRIERSPDGLSNWTVRGSVGAGVTSYLDTGLTLGQTYYYRVAANNDLDSDYSATASVTLDGLKTVTLFDEDFCTPLASPWTNTVTGGANNPTLTAAGTCAMTIGNLASKLNTTQAKAYIERPYNNSTSNYSIFTGYFDIDFHDMYFNPGTTNGAGDFSLFNHWVNGGNNASVRFSLGYTGYNDMYVVGGSNGIVWWGGGAGIFSQLISIGDLQTVHPRMRFQYQTTFTNNGGDNWTVATTWNISNLATGALLWTKNSSFTATAGGWNPLTEVSHRFQYGLLNHSVWSAEDCHGSMYFEHIQNTARTPFVGSGVLRFGQATYTVNEDSGVVQAVIPVWRTEGRAGAVTVHYETANDTATAGVDYIAQSGDLSWADQEDAIKTITIEIASDPAAEAAKTFNINLSVPTGGALLGSPATATVTIGDWVGSTPTATPQVGVSVSVGNLVFQFASTNGTTYRLMRNTVTPRADDVNWTYTGDNQTGNGTIQQFTAPKPASGVVFYRLSVTP